jgi:hypothetical protein
MKRDKFVPFVLGFVVGVLFMLLAGGSVGGVLIFTAHERALTERARAEAAEQQALEQRRLAEEQAAVAREHEQEARQRAEDALREAQRMREKP